MTILAALGAMFCKSLIDFIGCKAAKDGKNGANLYYIIQSITILTLQLILWGTGIINVSFDKVSVIYGLVVGAFSFISYLLYIYSLKGENGSVYITVYRLNFIVSSVIAIVGMNEKLTAGKSLGIIFCLLAIIMFVDFKQSKMKKYDKYITLAIIASITTGIMNIINKFALSAGSGSDSLLTYRYLVVVLICFLSSTSKNYNITAGLGKATKNVVLSAIASGTLMLGSLYMLYYALKTGDVSIVTPIVQSCFIFTSVLLFIFYKEKLTPKKITGIIFAICCIVVIGM